MKDLRMKMEKDVGVWITYVDEEDSINTIDFPVGWSAGNTVSRLYMNGTLRSWVHYIELRSAQGTQREHQLIAIACANELAKIFSLMNDYKKS